jgi:hypothetical protein
MSNLVSSEMYLLHEDNMRSLVERRSDAWHSISMVEAEIRQLTWSDAM